MAFSVFSALTCPESPQNTRKIPFRASEGHSRSFDIGFGVFRSAEFNGFLFKYYIRAYSFPINKCYWLTKRHHKDKKEGNEKVNLETIILIKRLVKQNKIKVDVVSGEVMVVQSGKHSHDMSTDEDGYLSFVIRVDGKRKTLRVHDVIAVIGGVYVANKGVYHVNGNKFDNRVYNLTTEKPQEPIEMKSTHLGFKRVVDTRHQLSEDDVREIKIQLQLGETMKKLAISHGVSPTTIRNIKVGKTWQHVIAPVVESKHEEPKPTWCVHWQN